MTDKQLLKSVVNSLNDELIGDQVFINRNESWSELIAVKAGSVLRDFLKDGYRCVVVRGPVGFCAYIGIPLHHPLANHSCDEIDLECHGGLSFEGTGNFLPKDYWFYGWDYSHYGDRTFYDIYRRHHQKEWTIDDVHYELLEALEEFKKLVKI